MNSPHAGQSTKQNLGEHAPTKPNKKCSNKQPKTLNRAHQDLKSNLLFWSKRAKPHQTIPTRRATSISGQQHAKKQQTVAG